MKKRDFFAVLAAGVVATVAVQALLRRLWGEPEYDDDYDDFEDDEPDDSENEALDDLLNITYDEGFADGFNGDYQGWNPAAQVLQAELNEVLAKCEMCACGIGNEPEEDGEPEKADESEEEEKAGGQPE